MSWQVRYFEMTFEIPEEDDDDNGPHIITLPSYDRLDLRNVESDTAIDWYVIRDLL